MARGICLLVACTLLLPLTLMADEEQDKPKVGEFMQLDDLETYKQLEEYSQPLAATGFEDFPMSSDVFNIDYRSPGKAFFYSLMVPSTGQLYTGSKFKAALFAGIEIVAWAAYFNYQGQGKDHESEYEVFGDGNWEPQQYQNWLIETYGITSDTLPYRDATGQLQTFSHHLPETRTQQYYEMIGKYDQFRYGWSDTDYRVNDSTSTMRQEYLVTRDDANNAFNKAKAFAIISIANHLLSAFDAAFAAKRYNHKQDTFTEIGVKARLAKYDGKQVPQLAVAYRFF